MSWSTRSPHAALALIGFLTLALASSLAAPADQLLRKFKNICECDAYKRGIFEVDLVDNDVYRWRVKLLDVDTKSELYWDLLKLRKIKGKEGYIEFEILLARPDEESKPPRVSFKSPHLIDPNNANWCQRLILDGITEKEVKLENLIMAVREYLVRNEIRVNFDKLNRS